jgi:uncharacterized protein
MSRRAISAPSSAASAANSGRVPVLDPQKTPTAFTTMFPQPLRSTIPSALSDDSGHRCHGGAPAGPHQTRTRVGGNASFLYDGAMQDRQGVTPMVAGIITQHKDEIAALCRKYRVRRLDLFGSATGNRFNPETSDIDFVVNFDDEEQGILYRFVDLADDLERLLQRSVDLLTERAVKISRFRSRVEASRITVYERDHDRAVA